MSGPVPVFNCHVYVGPAGPPGRVRARVANLAGLAAEAPSEREALRQVSAAFKRVVGEYTGSGQAIPWLDPPLVRESGEEERWLPVHL